MRKQEGCKWRDLMPYVRIVVEMVGMQLKKNCVRWLSKFKRK